MKILTSPEFIIVTINGAQEYIDVCQYMFRLDDVCLFIECDIDTIREILNKRDGNTDTEYKWITTYDLRYLLELYTSSEIQKMFQVRVFNNTTLTNVKIQYDKLKSKSEEDSAVVDVLEKMYNTTSKDSISTIIKYPSSCAMFAEIMETIKNKISIYTEIMNKSRQEAKLYHDKYELDNYNTEYEPDYVEPVSDNYDSASTDDEWY